MRLKILPRFIAFFALILYAFQSSGQVNISGKIIDETKNPLPFASVLLKGTYDGASTNDKGEYSFKTSEKGKQTLVFSYLGYETKEVEINIGDKNQVVNVTLIEKATEGNQVVISAGSFEASDKKRATILKPIDIVTTAGASGDITGAMKTLPGAQQIGEQEGLFVRGGDAGETKTIIDDMVVQNPYFSSIPDVPQRGRFSPFLFTGTVFSTGGYSALYGQALSSTLVLSTDDLADQTSTGVSITAVGFGANHTQRWKNTQLSIEGSYANLQPFFSLNPQNTEWVKPPESGNGALIFRQKTSETGIIKFYATYSLSHSILNFPSLTYSPIEDRFDIKNNNLYINATYSDYFNNWKLYTGLSYSKSHDNINFDTSGVLIPFGRTQELTQTKIYVTHPLANVSSDIKFGVDGQLQNFTDSFGIYQNSLKEQYAAVYAESDLFITRKLAARIGARAEYSKFLNKYNAAPRLSLAYKTGDKTQVSAAYGDFYQTPDRDLLYLSQEPYLYKSPGMTYELATHYILDYQYMDDDRTFRVEGYYKKYNNLARVYQSGIGQDSVVDNSGYGYADGLDIFWRDKKTFKHVDYWISYSYLDTKRLFRRYAEEAMPIFAAKHTLSVVYKQSFPAINSSISATFTYATGRPSYSPEFVETTTPDYKDISLGYSYLTQIWNNFTVVFVSIADVPNFKNIYGYRYSLDGKTAYPIIPPSYRTFFIGMFVDIGRKTSN